ncbi:helix-turn-helix domain-containing protein [Paenimyroides ceti]
MEINALTIKTMREKLGWSQTKLGEMIGSSLRTIQNYESGGAIPKSKIAILHSVFSEFSAKEDMHGDAIDIKNEVIIKQNQDEKEIFLNKNGVKFFIYPDDSYEIEVIKVPFPAYATYLEAYNDEEKLHNEFSTIRMSVDKIGKGYYMGFEIKNDSMNGGGIYDTPSGAEVLAREIGRHLWKSGFHKSKYGFILMTKNAIYHKDIKCYDDECGMLTLTSRDGITEEFEVSINDVFRIFNVIKRSF